jgi:hypothetical protein
MEVEGEATFIEVLSASAIGKKTGLKAHINKLLSTDQCRNTALGQSCVSKNCSLILYYSKKSEFHDDVNDIQGLISFVDTGNNTAEIFNLCTAAPQVTNELLKYTIAYNPSTDLWIGLKLSSPQFDNNVKIFAYLGFTNPVMSRESPSGIKLDYEFVSFRRLHNVITNKTLYETTIQSVKDLVNKYTVQQAPIKFKTFPANYKPDVRVKDTRIVKTESPKKESSRIVGSGTPKSPKKKVPTPEHAKEQSSITNANKIKLINADPTYGHIPFYRQSREGVSIQANCLNEFLPKGKLIDGMMLSGKDKDEVLRLLKEGGYVYEGTYGIVYQACDADKNCNYVIKVQTLGDESDIIEWRKEVELNIKFNEYDIGPKIAAAWICNDERQKQIFGIFAAEIWDGNLGAGDVDKCPPTHLINKLETQIKTIHKLGYVHGDIMPKNVLIRKDKNGTITDVTITDFGTVDTPAAWKRKERESNWIGIFYDYHTRFPPHIDNEGHGFLWPYYKSSYITLDDLRKDPKLMDNDILYYLRNKCK